MKDDRVYLQHVRDSVQRIQEYTALGQAVFFADSKTQDAVVRNLEIIGEAVKRVSDQVKLRYPAIPWKLIAGMRDKLIHDYFGVNLHLVWDVVVRELPRLDEAVKALLRTLEPPAESV